MPTPFTVAVPRAVEPSLKVTVPVAGMPCGAAIAAVKVKLAWAIVGFALLASVTPPAWRTCWFRADDRLPVLFVSPL